MSTNTKITLYYEPFGNTYEKKTSQFKFSVKMFLKFCELLCRILHRLILRR